MADTNPLHDFVSFTKGLKGDEKGEAQLFCDRFFRAFGHGGIIEAKGKLEARIKFGDTGRTKFADCIWAPDRADGVLIEMKKRSEKNLAAHFPQVRDYWIEMNPEKVIGPGAQKPKFIILCNFDTFIIYQHLTRVDEITIDQFIDRASAFNFMLPAQKEPIFHNNVEEISQDAARTIGAAFKHVVFEQKIEPQVAQRFFLQCVLALFSEDVGLLPPSIFTEAIRDCQKGQSSYDLFGGLFRQMANPKRANAGRFKDVRYFNGGIFDVVEPIELDAPALGHLAKAADFKWKSVNPAIFGALFESTLNERERHRFGAHFTNEADILKIVTPTIIRPWKDRIRKAQTLQELTRILDDLEKYIVLDPACGCGNFLFVAYRELKELEMQVIETIAANFAPRSLKPLKFGFSRIRAAQFRGIDLLPVAVEVAKVTMMLAKELASEEWNKRIAPLMSLLDLDFDEGLPLERLDEFIIKDDALFCDWPKADAIIGNPPYQSKNKMQQEMDREYIDRVRSRYSDVPGRADYCVYWFKRAHDELDIGERAGLVGTNTIRQNYSREGGLDYIVANGGTITDAVSTQVWSGDAAVHVSIVNWIKGSFEGTRRLAIQRGDALDSPIDYFDLESINSALSTAVDLQAAKPLIVNSTSKACYQGQTHGHKGFLLTAEEAQAILTEQPESSDVLFPFLTADEMIGNLDAQPTRYVIDFRKHDVFSAQKYSRVFGRVQSIVRSTRAEAAKKEADQNKATLAKNPKARVNRHHANFFSQWWKLSYARDELMDILEATPRYCVCGQVTKRPIFEFVSNTIHPNAALIVFPLADDYSFGVLQSAVHWEWFTARCSTLTERFRYTSNSVFDSFPWPQDPTSKQIEAIAAAAKDLRDTRRRTMRATRLSLRDVYRIAEEAEDNPINHAQDRLDTAVRAAYGMKKNTDVLAFLLNLNIELANKEMTGAAIVGPGIPAQYASPSKLVSTDCIELRE